MSISFPLTLPINIGTRNVSLKYETSVSVFKNPYNLRSTTYVHDGQQWIAEISMPMMNRDLAEEWTTFLLSLNGVEGTFWLWDTTVTEPRGVATGAPLVKGAGQTGQELLTDGWTPSTVNILRKGDYLQIGTSLYKLLKDVDSDGSGNATLDIFPKLREAYADNTSIIVDSPKGLFRLSTNNVTVHEIAPDKNYSISFTAVEAI